MTKAEHWTDAHITQHPLTKEYTGWDETGTWVVAQSMFHSVVVEALTEYSNNLNRGHCRLWENQVGEISM